MTQKRQKMRLPYYDYSRPGYYFITICTKNRKCYFGNIDNSRIILSKIGGIAKKCWQEIPEHFNSVKLGEYIIMPNHIHGIVIITSVGKADLPSLQMNDRTKMLLPKIIHGFKSSVTRITNKNNTPFAWQKSYYDHVIRNEKSLSNISEYIINNIASWQNDLENLERFSNLIGEKRKLILRKHYSNLFDKQ